MLAQLFTFRGALSGPKFGLSLFGLAVVFVLGAYAVTMVSNMPIVIGGVSPDVVQPFRVLGWAVLISLCCWSVVALVSRRLRDIGLTSAAAAGLIPLWLVLIGLAFLLSPDVALCVASAPFGILSFMPKLSNVQIADTFS